MKLLKKMIPLGPQLLRSKKWLQTVVDHKALIIARDSTITVDVSPILAYKLAGKLSLLFNHFGIDYKYHTATMIINDIPSLNYPGEDITSLIIPDVNYLDNLAKKLNGLK